MTLTALTQNVGGSSHSVGRTLTTAGLRRGGKPSSRAFALRLAQRAPVIRGRRCRASWRTADEHH